MSNQAARRGHLLSKKGEVCCLLLTETSDLYTITITMSYITKFRTGRGQRDFHGRGPGCGHRDFSLKLRVQICYVCVYVAIGIDALVVTTFQERGAMEYTIVIV